MSPLSSAALAAAAACYSVGACKAERDLGAMVRGGGEDVRSTAAAGGLHFSRRHPESAHRGSNSALKVSRDSHRIRKPPLPLPPVQYRPPIIIHTYSPKIIHAQPDDFMSLVQKLTGSSDTRLRLKSKPPNSPKSPPPPSTQSTSLERQGSGASSATVTNCGSPSSSEESATVLVADQSSSRGAKQSNSPRSPLDSHFEFDTVSDALMLNQFPGFADAAASGSAMFHHHGPQVVKTEFSFHDTSINNNNPFATFFADFMHHHPKPVQPPPRPSMHSPHQSMSPFIAPVPPSPNLMADLHWSQSTYLDHGGSQFVNQAPYLRQRPSYSPSPDGTTMVALENIHAFMLT